jgi:heptosyltransferase III
MKNGVVSQSGLGDGLVAMTLSNNLFINGIEVITFQNGFFDELQGWFPHLPIKKFPPTNYIPQLFKDFERIFVFYDSGDPFIQTLIKEGKEKWPKQIKVISHSFSKSFNKLPFYEDCLFQPTLSMVDNIFYFCRDLLKLEKLTKVNGICCPYSLHHRMFKKRVALHSFSAKPGRSWPRKKFINLYHKLRELDLDPCFFMNLSEKKVWDDEENKNIKAIGCQNLNDLASYIYESGYFIGNDSGIGHLASCLGIPLVSISRSKRTAALWRPGWGRVEVVYPYSFIPNIRGLRLRDKKWKFFISTRRVFKRFKKNIFKK